MVESFKKCDFRRFQVLLTAYHPRELRAALGVAAVAEVGGVGVGTVLEEAPVVHGPQGVAHVRDRAGAAPELRLDAGGNPLVVEDAGGDAVVHGDSLVLGHACEPLHGV